MSHYEPVTIRAITDQNDILFEYRVPFEFEVSAKRLLERAFVLGQVLDKTPDPFQYTMEYYGYSYNPQLPGYLGYEIESFAKNNVSYPNTDQFYWELIVDGVASSTGADTAYPNPGGSVVWQYQAIAADAQNLSARSKEIHRRRFARSTR